MKTEKRVFKLSKNKEKNKKGREETYKKLLKFLLLLLHLHNQIITQKELVLSLKQKITMLTITEVYGQQHSKVYG